MVGFLIRAYALGKVPPDHLPFETSRDRLSTDCLLPVPPPGIEPGSPAYDARAEPTEPGRRWLKSRPWQFVIETDKRIAVEVIDVT